MSNAPEGPVIGVDCARTAVMDFPSSLVSSSVRLACMASAAAAAADADADPDDEGASSAGDNAPRGPRGPVWAVAGLQSWPSWLCWLTPSGCRFESALALLFTASSVVVVEGLTLHVE